MSENVQAMLDKLNAYQGDNIWQDVILGFEGYNEELTDTVEHGQSDEFVAHGTVSSLTPLTMHFKYIAQDRVWTADPYNAPDPPWNRPPEPTLADRPELLWRDETGGRPY